MNAVKLIAGQQYGDPIDSRSIGSFRLAENTYAPGYVTPVHSHERALFCFVLAGSYTETYGSRLRHCQPASLTFHPAQEIHKECFHQNGGRSFVIELDCLWLDSIRRHAPVSDEPAQFHGGIGALLGRRLYREFQELDEVSPLVIEGLLLEIIGEVSRQATAEGSISRHVPRWLRQTRELLRERFCERLTLAAIAAEVGVHPTHLAQTFQQTFHCTVGECIRQLRVDYACRQLDSTNVPLATIALDAGFCDQSHFTRTFKRYVGVAPSEYRS